MSNCIEEKLCSFCGQLLFKRNESIFASGGRPRIDHDKCGNVKRMLSWCSKELVDIDLTPERAAVVRSDLMQMANALPVARLSNGRYQSKKRREGEL